MSTGAAAGAGTRAVPGPSIGTQTRTTPPNPAHTRTALATSRARRRPAPSPDTAHTAPTPPEATRASGAQADALPAAATGASAVQAAATGASAVPVDVTCASAVPADATGGGVASAGEARRRDSRSLRAHLGTLVGTGILVALLWRLGTGVLLDGLRRIDAVTVLAALGIGAVTTVFSAWRWQLVARGLRLRLPLGAAVADYYRALFLNAALPGGILGDVHRAVRHGQSAGDLKRGVKAVVLERVAGQVALAVAGAAVLLTLPSPVRADVRGFAPLLALAAAGALAVALAVRMNRPPARRGGALRQTLGEARRGLASRQSGPGVALSSAIVLAGHLAMFVVAARIAGSAAPVAVLVPLAVLALVAMGLPLNVGGFGPREGVTAWAFGAAGLGADTGVAVAVVYGVLSLVASLPGAVVLAWRWYEGLRAGSPTPAPGRVPGPRPAVGPALPGPPATDVRLPAECRGAGTRPPDGESATDERLPAGAAPMGPGRAPAPGYSSPVAEVSSAKYGSKDFTRLANSAFPFSAEPREGRPMTPDSV
ncbi:lysylphosphatidylglycerol synthase domain-containing protein [Streptomyces actinomycinicus]|uniref:lysylphosphatidylglycerol synthase domain-containing protein n=1 Tax=Streptomyces actinomycinicus TaxID=1695166 RepID=UPI001F24E18B|nr:lysylphosphatidylglycerol synthase domain-containing protein [Streptomyces actinomycinicus]